jgi:tetratricopeptide (TPR) repeat protein
MKIPGVNSILYMRAKVIWPGEHRPSTELMQLIDDVTELMQLLDEKPDETTPESFEEAVAILFQIEQFQLAPSQMMRFLFLRGQLLTESHEYARAYEQYYDALCIADDHEDLDSRILLANLAGRMMYGLMRNQDALAYYQEALDVWRIRAEQLAKPRTEPEVKFQERIGTVKWLLGEVDDARATLARTLTTALYKRGVPHTKFLRKTTADALWSLGLSLRSQSDLGDGGINLLRTAIKRTKKAAKIYKAVGTYNTNMGRLYIQIAELYLDLAEMHLLHGNDKAAHRMRKNALRYLAHASSFVEPAIDVSGVLLVKLTRLRHMITTRPERNVARVSQTFENELLQIKRQAVRGNDGITLAKMATLQGEWLLWLSRPEPARAALLEALRHFRDDGMGMATRAQRLLRRTNSPEQVFALRHASRRPD